MNRIQQQLCELGSNAHDPWKDHAPAEPSYETAAPADTSTAAVRDPDTEDATELCLDS